MQGSNIKNAADVIIKTPFSVFGKNGSLIFNSLVIVFLFVSVFYIEKKYQFSSIIFIPMLTESLAYALFIGYGVGSVVYRVLFTYVLARPFSSGKFPGIILSVGAGVYEEIVFRLLLLSTLYFIFTNLLKIKKPIGVTISIILGAVVFTSIHYVGTLSDNFTYTNFMFRLLSGLVLSTIFMLRGLGIAVYTHSIYDVLSVLKPFHA